MKNLISKFLILFFLIVGCSDDFGDMNVDPNNPSTAIPDLLLTQSITQMSGVAGAVTPVLYVQYMSETQYTEDSRYNTIQFDFNPWYTGPLADLQSIIDSEDATGNYKAAAKILKGYYLSMMTDRWGMIPYSEALKGGDNFSPVYDSQESIYKGIISDITTAVTEFDENSSLNGDILFNGVTSDWQKFGNTIRMIMALRLSDVDESYASTEFSNAVDAGVIDSDVMYYHLAEDANASPWYVRFITRTDYAISNTMADTMQAFNDARLTAFADPAPDLDDGDATTTLDEVVGMTYGISNNEAGAITNSEISFPGASIRSQDSPLPIYTIAQVHLSMAEAIERGWIAGNAQEEYESGITASWDQWGVGEPGEYLNQEGVSYSSDNWDKLIGYQKWIAAFPSGYEAWSEWRRLDYPELEPAPGADQNLNIPLRHAYPTSETELNATNYDNAIATQGADDLYTKMWWDTK